MTDTGSQSIDAAQRGITLARVLKLAARADELGFNVCGPARVQLWDSVNRRVDVVPQILTVVRGNTPATADVETPLGPMVLSRLPYLQLGGSLARVSVPIAVGDPGIVIYADRSLERYKLAGVPDAPQDGRAHSKADGIFLHGVPTDLDVAATVPPPDPAALELEGAAIKLGALATHFAALGTPLVEALTTFATAIAAANTTWAGNPATAPAFSTALGAALVDLLAGLAPPLVLSTKVRVQ